MLSPLCPADCGGYSRITWQHEARTSAGERGIAGGVCSVYVHQAMLIRPRSRIEWTPGSAAERRHTIRHSRHLSLRCGETSPLDYKGNFSTVPAPSEGAYLRSSVWLASRVTPLGPASLDRAKGVGLDNCTSTGSSFSLPRIGRRLPANPVLVCLLPPFIE